MIKFSNLAQIKRELPKRSDFLNEKLVNAISNRIEKRKPVQFMPNDLIENHISINGEHCYVIYLIGILPDGSKATVVLEGIDVYFDVRVPPGVNIKEFSSDLRHKLYVADCTPDKQEVVYRKPFKLYCEERQPFIRVYYKAHYRYKKAIKYMLNETSYETASNDQSCYYRKVAREYKFNTAGWNIVSKYVIDKSGNLANTTYVLRVNIKNFKPYDVKKDDPTCLHRDYSLECGWDIESYTIPSARDGFVYTDKLERDTVFMICLSFNWHHNPKPIYDITITTMPCTDKKDSPTILCKKQSELFIAMAGVLNNFRPEFITGFNDGGYDFPMLLNRMEGTSLINIWKRELSCIPFNEKTGRWIIKGDNTEPRIKIAADINVSRRHFRVPGLIPFDTQTVFQRIFPTAESKSLDFFLKKCRLPLKNEMPIPYMFKLLDILYNVQSKIDADPLWDLDELILNVKDKLNIENIDEKIIKLRELDDIREYCRVDAKRCPELCCICTVIGDVREKSIKSFTTVYDGFYRADGMKVRNLTMARGHDKGFVFNTIGNKNIHVKNYPGGYVFPPDKGLKKFTQAEKIKFKLLDDLPDWRERLENLEVRPIYDEQSARDTLQNAGLEQLIDKWIELMEYIEYDRPSTGLDFSSLYPSLIRTYNFSPDKCIKDIKIAKKIGLDKLYKVNFNYEKYTGNGKEAVEVEAVGWFIPHNNDPEKMGLYVVILGELFDERSAVKKVMLMLQSVEKFMKKFGNKGMNMENLIDIANDQVKEAENNPNLKSDHKRTKSYAELKLKIIKDIRNYLIEHADKSYEKLLEDVEFEAGKLNSKQLALKVFMNTFYGEAGNQISPFYELLVSGSITNRGQYNIKLVDAKVRELTCCVKYGDTDSVYVSSPHYVFREIDKAYALCEINREEYWMRMVDITMDNIDEVKVKVNNMLIKDNGSPYLKVAYEEVLWPYYYAAKKKYFGIPHEREIQNQLWYSMDLPIDEFSGELFLRGMDAKKRGSSGFLKDRCFTLWRELLDIRTCETAFNCTIKHINDTMSQNWEDRKHLFIKRGRYKKAAPGMPGNVSVLTFIKRMSERNIPIPEVGDRFSYIVTKPQGVMYDLRGRKKNPSVGDMMEFPEVIDEEPDKYQINLDYYMTGEIVGQFARTIVYDKMFNEPDENGNISDKRAITLAKNYLLRYYKEKYATTMSVPNEYKKTFRQVNKNLINQCENIFGDSSALLKVLNVAMTGSESNGIEYQVDIRKAINSHIEKVAKKLSQEHDVELAKFLRNKNTNLITLRRLFNNDPSGIICARRRIYDTKYRNALSKIYKNLTKLSKICDNMRESLREFINGEYDAQLDELQLSSFSEDDSKIIDEINGALQEAIVYKKCINDDYNLVERMSDIIDTRDNTVIPKRPQSKKYAAAMVKACSNNTSSDIMNISGI